MAEGFGLPIDGGASWSKAVREFVKNPCEETWDMLAHKIIPGSRAKTMWQAWVAVDPDAPRSLPSCPDVKHAVGEWGGRLPNVFILRRMIETAQERAWTDDEFVHLLRGK